MNDSTAKPCAYALGHLNQQFRRNRISPCYRTTAKFGDHSTELMSSVINSPEARQHRLDLMSGKWPDGCASCRDFEESNIRSTRLHGLSDETFDMQRLISGYNGATGEIDPSNITSIEIRFGNECNLQCRHCDHAHSSRWEAERKRNPELMSRLGLDYRSFDQPKPPGYYEDILEKIVPHVNTIMFSGGETLYQKQHYEFISSIPDEHAARIRLLYVTNGTVTGIGRYNVFDLWKKFGSINVIVSTDGTGRLYEYFRHGARWDDTVTNMRAFKAAGVLVTAEVTTSVFQILDLPRICDDLFDADVDIMSSSLVQSPEQLNVRLIPRHIKEEITAGWDSYLVSLTDQRKIRMARDVGDMVIGYMNAENNTGYEWSDFIEYADVLDKILGTDMRQDCPSLAQYLS